MSEKQSSGTACYQKMGTFRYKLQQNTEVGSIYAVGLNPAISALRDFQFVSWMDDLETHLNPLATIPKCLYWLYL